MDNISVMGCGWFGFPLAKELVSLGYSVKGSTTSPNKIDSIAGAGIEPYLVKLGEESDTLIDFLNSKSLVLNVPPGKSTHEVYRKNMIDLANKVANSQVKKVIFISSTSVYPNKGGIVAESDAANIKTPRSGITMLEIENVWNQLKSQKVNVVRFAGLYGPERNPGRFLAGKTTNGSSNPINMIHLDDCIGIITKLIKSDYLNETFNACAPGHPSREEFYNLAASKFGYDQPDFQPPHSTDSKIVSSEKLTEITGYQFIHPDPIASLDSL